MDGAIGERRSNDGELHFSGIDFLNFIPDFVGSGMPMRDVVRK